VGCNLELYVIRQRVKAAQLLLTTTTLAVGRIARQLGYSNLGHLSRQFQREMSCSPSEYRRAHSADQHAPLTTGEADTMFETPDKQPNPTNFTSPSHS
jgi:AraC-like DNA-binding protein